MRALTPAGSHMTSTFMTIFLQPHSRLHFIQANACGLQHLPFLHTNTTFPSPSPWSADGCIPFPFLAGTLSLDQSSYCAGLPEHLFPAEDQLLLTAFQPQPEPAQPPPWRNKRWFYQKMWNDVEQDKIIHLKDVFKYIQWFFFFFMNLIMLHHPSFSLPLGQIPQFGCPALWFFAPGPQCGLTPGSSLLPRP